MKRLSITLLACINIGFSNASNATSCKSDVLISQSNDVFSQAIERSDHNTIDRLLNDDDFSYAIDSKRRYPIIVAAQMDDVYVLETLLSSDPLIELEVVSPRGDSALHIAVRNENLKFVETLLSSGANPNALVGRVSLHAPLVGGTWSNIEVTMAYPPRGCPEAIDLSYNADRDFGVTALAIAAKRGNNTIVDLLLEYEANPNIATFECYTPFDYAVESGHSTIANILLKNGANREARGRCEELLHGPKSAVTRGGVFMLNEGHRLTIDEYFKTIQ